METAVAAWCAPAGRVGTVGGLRGSRVAVWTWCVMGGRVLQCLSEMIIEHGKMAVFLCRGFLLCRVG